MTELDTILRSPLSRRAFLARMSAAGLGAAAVALLAGCGGGGSNGNQSVNSGGGGGGGAAGNSVFALPGGGLVPGTGDVQVLNYALALETTEADLYRLALNIASGKAITTPLSTSGYTSYTFNGNGTGTGTNPTLSGALASIGFLYLAQYAYVEAAHRDFLLTQLGHQADTPGQLTTTNTTNPVLNAKGYHLANLTASSGLGDILGLLRIVEETGVTAYLGAVPYLSSSTAGLGYAQVAAAIYSTEARHSAGVNYVLGQDAGPSGVAGGAQPNSGATNEFEYAQAPSAVLSTVVSMFYN